MSEQQKNAIALRDAIMANMKSFAMRDWVGRERLGHDEDPNVCGTTLCAAGWMAHLLGYAVYDNGVARHWTSPEVEDDTYAVAKEALELNHHQAVLLFYADEDDALAAICHMAEGNGFDNGGLESMRNK